ncbi:hypothetical protein AB0L85_02970 [Streptomyces sp. NPDC052051]|uniref:hypothetical protein n=1 Tax=Streptomyces sp. NPDC052051 TaxID=3154649 RepID=UPI0034153FB7
MMYGFLTAADGVPGAVPGILADAFGVQVSEIDVSEISELESRNWDALVTCEYEQVEGDLPWSLSIYKANEVAENPSEDELAILLSKGLDAPVFYGWSGELPWIRRVAQPDGGITLARLDESNGDGTGFSVQAAESSLTGFPNVPVENFPEVVRALDIPTPVTDSAVPAGMGEGLERVRSLLANWERLCIRMRSNWPPSGWYSAEMYQEDLKLRDQLEVIPKASSEADQIRNSLAVLDSQYREMSVEDHGHALSAALEEQIAVVQDKAWYWQRCPVVLPWAGE